MQVNDLGLGGVLEIIPKKLGDARGFFSETYQRQRFMARNRMSRQELKDEHKQTEGDPHIKARIRQI